MHPKDQEFNCVYTGQQQFPEDVCICGGIGGSGQAHSQIYVPCFCVWLAPDPVWAENTEPQPSRELRRAVACQWNFLDLNELRGVQVSCSRKISPQSLSLLAHIPRYWATLGLCVHLGGEWVCFSLCHTHLHSPRF